MNIGIVENSLELSAIKTGLEQSGNKIIVYCDEQQATNALFEARFNNTSLPVGLLLIDGNASDENETITQRIRKVIPPEELTIIVINGNAHRLNISVLGKPATPTTAD